MPRQILLALALVALLCACDKAPRAAGPAAAARTLLLAPEDLLTPQNGALASGPVITGSVQAERNADLRAEVAALVLQVLKENGERVKQGELLVRLDETAIRDSLNSAEEASRAALRALDQAERMLERQRTLRASGMASMQALEDAEIRRNNAQSELAAARTRAAQARQQLQRTGVRAPFDGVVSERKVSSGDTAQIGKELIRVIDPASMRFEGLVSADQIGVVKPGQAVRLRVNGYPDEFAGAVRRVEPAANPVTRQVAVLVDFAGAAALPGVAGLYGEGRIEAARAAVLTLPETALVRAGEQAWAWRLRGRAPTPAAPTPAALERVALTLGARDARSGQWQVRAGLAAGDRVLRHPGAGLKDGQQVELAAPAGAGR